MSVAPAKLGVCVDRVSTGVLETNRQFAGRVRGPEGNPCRLAAGDRGANRGRRARRGTVVCGHPAGHRLPRSPPGLCLACRDRRSGPGAGIDPSASCHRRDWRGPGSRHRTGLLAPWELRQFADCGFFIQVVAFRPISRAPRGRRQLDQVEVRLREALALWAWTLMPSIDDLAARMPGHVDGDVSAGLVLLRGAAPGAGRDPEQLGERVCGAGARGRHREGLQKGGRLHRPQRAPEVSTPARAVRIARLA